MAETDHYVVLDKPALLDSQNSKPGRPSVVEWLQKKFGFAGLVHRLDFGTSGLLVCAKNAESANLLTKKLQEGAIDRSYIALVLGKILPDSGSLESEVDGKPARLEFRVRERFRNATLVEVLLETGRKHQIRVQFADAGHPLLGDHLHGKKGAKLLFNRPALHAFRLKVDGRVYEAKMPRDLEELIARLR